MALRPEFISFETPEGSLGALRWQGIDGAPTVLAVHGITANAWHFDPLAHHLAGGATIVALDLRGRGRSHLHAGPFGIRRHAGDVADVARQLGGQITLIGHSMGAYVALLAAEGHPRLFHGVVVVDGGTPLPAPVGIDIEAALTHTLGPALGRLQTTWPDRVSYQTMWSQHPAFEHGIGLDLQRTLLADLVDAPGGFRAAVNEAAVIVDGRDLLADDEIRNVLVRRRVATTIVRAPLGLDGAAPPLIADEVVASMPQHRWTTIEDTNHYTVLLDPFGAAAVANAVRAQLAA
ncbi:MAG: alpha/beta hydrolase [Ilumatobacter sp.]